MVYYMELSQGQIIQKPNKQGLSSLFMTHRLNVMHAPVKYGLGVMAGTRIGTDVCMDICMDVRTDIPTDVHTDVRMYGTDRGNT